MNLRNKIYLISAPLLGLIFAALTLIFLGYYPIALVGKGFISARKFSIDLRAFSIYYHNVVEKNPALLEEYEKSGSGDFKARVLNKLAEDSLIGEAARRESGSSFRSELENKLKFSAGDPAIDKAANSLFGLSGDMFREEVLVPQAEREILEWRILSGGENFDEWLLRAKKNYRVVIFLKGFAWIDGRVVKK